MTRFALCENTIDFGRRARSHGSPLSLGTTWTISSSLPSSALVAAASAPGLPPATSTAAGAAPASSPKYFRRSSSMSGVAASGRARDAPGNASASGASAGSAILNPGMSRATISAICLLLNRATRYLRAPSLVQASCQRPSWPQAGELPPDLVFDRLTAPSGLTVRHTGEVLGLGVKERLGRRDAGDRSGPEGLVERAAEVVIRLDARGVMGAGATDERQGPASEVGERDGGLGRARRDRSPGRKS